MASISTKNKSINLAGLLLLLGFILCSVQLQAQQLAFPGAEGFGRFTTGGRGGAVYEVTNLNDSGVGSFRDAVLKSGTRTIVFRVSGTITLLSPLTIKNGNLTIAGQTAPGDGICIKNNTVTIDADNVIIRFMRFRLGDEAQVENDAMWGRNRQNIMIDHCSLSWAVDEVGSFYDNKNFTMQWCILSESLYRSVHNKGDHGYGGIWGGQGATFHHNLLAHHSSRNPRFNGARYSNQPALEIVDYRNNVLYNWGGNSAYGGERGNHNIVNNYYKYGPATTSSSKRNRILDANAPSEAELGRWYVNGNYVHGYPATTADNWNGGVQNVSSAWLAIVRVNEPFNFAPVRTQTAEEAYLAVLDSAGAILPKRDAVDARIVHETRTGTATYGGAYGAGRGIIDTQATVGGWPTLNSEPAPADTDKDGMPDAWETENGLNPNDASDRNGDFNGNGYTNLEKYLNSLTRNSVTSLPDHSQKYNVTVYPNPFTSHTFISFTVKQLAEVSVKIYDVTGRQVTSLLETKAAPGAYEVNWDGKDAAKNNLKAGLYLCAIQVGQDKIVKRIALARE
ncbi:hypothetical protein ABID22_000604 [Pontibacter aydingkolensis]|uniref:T9SS type A sorting domain-containing protein n=1 Tax=Pontibacter aydingkolensis TaxID=1911536 RepID=A0ABS7CRS8_9BACT|nr:FlgD immunoglobulin-like domain containing protein [Pontibacter aydingkolensis]MBW7466519.1 T9SS type A sorting domain-containing protein [Pontibacter aydingkolensis]